MQATGSDMKQAETNELGGLASKAKAKEEQVWFLGHMQLYVLVLWLQNQEDNIILPVVKGIEVHVIWINVCILYRSGNPNMCAAIYNAVLTLGKWNSLNS